jgi:hypothetical protein
MVLVGIAPYERVVVNPAQGWGLKFEVIAETSGPGCQPERRSEPSRGNQSSSGSAYGGCTHQNVAYPVDLSATEMEFVTALGDFYQETHGTMKGDVVMRGDQLNMPACPDSMCVNPNRTAHDVARNFIVASEVRAAIDGIMNSVSAFRHISDFLLHAVGTVWLGDSMEMSVTVIFSDDSKVVFFFGKENGYLGALTFSEDAYGLPIMNPGNASSFIGSWTYPHTFQAGDFLDNARRQGIPLYGPGGGGYGPGITCIYDPVSQQTMCRQTLGGGG